VQSESWWRGNLAFIHPSDVENFKTSAEHFASCMNSIIQTPSVRSLSSPAPCDLATLLPLPRLLPFPALLRRGWRRGARSALAHGEGSAANLRAHARGVLGVLQEPARVAAADGALHDVHDILATKNRHQRTRAE
jgi:hypothetical protein